MDLSIVRIDSSLLVSALRLRRRSTRQAEAERAERPSAQATQLGFVPSSLFTIATMADSAAIDCGPPRLPAEVLEIIFVMAATGDQQTACRLALVSREVCSITTEARTSTAVLRTLRSAQLFFSAIWHSPEMLSVARRRFPGSTVTAMMESLGGDPLLSRTRRPQEWSTMPRMDHLYIEMRDFDLRQWDAFWNTLAECYSTLFGSRQGSPDEDAVAISKHVDLFAQDLSLGLEESKYHAPKPVMDLPGSSDSSSQPCRLSSRNLTIVIDYSDTDEHAILSDWVLCYPLERLHVVGCASQSEEAGYTPEFEVLTRARAGDADSIAAQDISYSSTGQWSGVPKLTHSECAVMSKADIAASSPLFIA